MSTDQIDSLLLHWQERRRQGDAALAEELCRDCPELLPELARRIANLESDPVDPTATTVRVSATEPGRQGPGDWPRVKGYVIEGELGRGGMGVVYRATQIGAERTVALKMISGRLRPSVPEIERFRREARLLASMQHPNIVQVFEVGEHDGLPFFSMEYVAGGPLGRRLGGQPLPPANAARVVATVARALHAAHGQDILHRDLKPSNILLALDPAAGRSSPHSPAGKQSEGCPSSLTPVGREKHEEGQGLCSALPTLPLPGERPEATNTSPPLAGFIPKVADFGLAKHVEQDEGHTPSGVAIGTPSYMAPEQARADKDLTRAIDIYGLGAILYELLTGRPPFREETSRETMLAVLLKEPKPPRAVRPGVPRDLEAVCLKCLHKDPTRRYATAEELAEELDRWSRGEPTHARPPGWPRRAVRFIKKNPTFCVVTLLLLAVLVGMGAGWFFSSRRRLVSAQQKLAAGKTVTLIGEDGPPIWSALPVYDRDGVEISDNRDRPYRVSTFGIAAIELLPDVPLARYRVRARIKHEEGAIVSRVGLYVGRRAYKTPTATVHYFYELVVTDQPLGGHRLPLRVNLRRLSNPQPKENRHARVLLGFPNNVPPPALEEDTAPWREIVVDVTPEALRAWENGRYLGEVKLNEHRKTVQWLIARHGREGADDPPSPTEGGFGLLVEGGAALFRDVRVGPIEGDP